MEGEEKQGLIDLDFFKLKPEYLGDFDVLSERILDIISEQLGFVVPSVIMYDKHVCGFRVVNYRIPGGIEMVVERAIGKSISDIVFPLEAKNNLFVRAYTSRSIQIAYSVADMVIPVLPTKHVRIFDKLLNVRMMAVVPIIVDNACLGVFGFGSRNKSDLTDIEKHFLRNLSQQIGHYLKHAWIIKMLIEQNRYASEKNERLQSVLKLNQESIKSLYGVLDKVSRELELSSEDISEIEEHLRYLRSLSLLGEYINKK